MQLQLPTIKVMANPTAYHQERAQAQQYRTTTSDANTTSEEAEKWLDSSAVVIPEEEIDFEADFFGSLGSLIGAMRVHLQKDVAVHAVIVCAEADELFAAEVSAALRAESINVSTQRELGLVQAVLPEGTGVIVPVLSASFLAWAQSAHVLQSAQLQYMDVLPLLRDFQGYNEAMNTTNTPSQPQLSYINSVLNRKNRLPASADFEEDLSTNLVRLSSVLRELVSSGSEERSSEGTLKRRIPKYSSLFSASGNPTSLRPSLCL